MAKVWNQEYSVSLLIAHSVGSTLNQHVTSAANALNEDKRPEKQQQNSYSSVQDPANNQALIKEVRNRYVALTAVLLEIQVFSAVMLYCWISGFIVFLTNMVPSSSGSGSPQSSCSSQTAWHWRCRLCVSSGMLGTTRPRLQYHTTRPVFTGFWQLLRNVVLYSRPS